MKISLYQPTQIQIITILNFALVTVMLSCRPDNLNRNFPTLKSGDNLDTLVYNTYFKGFQNLKAPINFVSFGEKYFYDRGIFEEKIRFHGSITTYKVSNDSLSSFSMLLLKSDSNNIQYFVDEIKWKKEEYHKPLSKIKGVYIVNPVTGDNHEFRSISVIRKKLNKILIKNKIKKLQKFKLETDDVCDLSACNHYIINDNYYWTENDVPPKSVIEFIRNFNALIN